MSDSKKDVISRECIVLSKPSSLQEIRDMLQDIINDKEVDLVSYQIVQAEYPYQVFSQVFIRLETSEQFYIDHRELF